MVKCKYCGKNIDPGNIFAVEGKYPLARARIWWKETLLGSAPPESHGDIHHKECYFKHQSGNPTRQNNE